MPSKHRIPKDIDKYIPKQLAGARLIMTAVESVLSLRKGVRVKWELKLRYYYPEEVLEEIKSPAVAMGGTITSGPTAEGWD